MYDLSTIHEFVSVFIYQGLGPFCVCRDMHNKRVAILYHHNHVTLQSFWLITKSLGFNFLMKN